MSFRRKIHDGVLTGGSNSSPEWGNPFFGKSKASKYAAQRRTKKDINLLTGSSEGESDKDRYLITYADVITLLLGLFIILYSISNVDLQKFRKFKEAFGSSLGSRINLAAPVAADTEINIAPISTLKDKLAAVINDNGFSQMVALEENEKGIIVHLSEEILFSSGKAELDKSSVEVLNKIAGVMAEIPNEIRIEGHTDNIPVTSGTLKSNWHLSVMRALNTAYHLITNEKLKQERVSIVGYSEYKPISSNSTPEGRAQNRRVDIVILKEKN